MVPKTNINWKGFKNRAIGNQFPPTANKLRENLSAFLRAAENPLNSSERLEVDQSCECMSWEGGGGEEVLQPETNPGREGGKKKKKRERKSHKKNPENWASVLLSQVIILGDRRSAASSLWSEASATCQRETGGCDPGGGGGTAGVASDASKHSPSISPSIQSSICCLHWGLFNGSRDSADPNIIKYGFMYFGCCLSGAHWWLTLQLIVLTRGGNTVIIGLYSRVFCDDRQETVRAIAKENHRRHYLEKKLLMKVQRAEQQLESLRCLQDIHQLFNMLTVETEIQNITLICRFQLPQNQNITVVLFQRNQDTNAR